MGQEATAIETMRSNLIVTKKVRERILDWSKDEHAFFNMQKTFEIHIEKRPVNAQGETSIVMYFDNETNKILAEKVEGRIVVMDCVVKYDGLLATNIRAFHAKFPLRTNRRLSVKLQLVTTSTAAGMPIDLHTKIRELPIAEERSEYVKKRISSWEGYLKIQERDANIEDMTATYSNMQVNNDFSRMTLVCNGIKGNAWSKLKGLSVSLKGFRDNIGDVLKVNPSKKTVEIELRGDIKELVRRNQVNSKTKEVVFSNFATLSQIRRLRKGFTDLEKGLAANANLEKILFEDHPTIRAPKKIEELDFHNQLNQFQREAVLGAMTAEDLYVIQGPPGTGKTTVISEICQQNAKAGLRTLVASQSNLAVDNALSRLLSNKDIRILRFGRTESIEEEGKKFIEENVGEYWKEQTLKAIKDEISNHELKEKQLTQSLTACKEMVEVLKADMVRLTERIEEKKKAKEKQIVLTEQILTLKKRLVVLKKELQSLEDSSKTNEQNLNNVASEIEQLQHFLQENLTVEELRDKRQHAEAEIEQTRQHLLYRQATEELGRVEQALQKAKSDYMAAQRNVQELEVTVRQMEAFKKVDQLISFMQQHHIASSYVIDRQIVALEKLKVEIVELQIWEQVNERLTAVIYYIEALLGSKIEIIKSKVSSMPAQNNFYSAHEIHESIDQIKQHLLSSKQAMDHIKLGAFLEGLYLRRQYVWLRGRELQEKKQESTRLFKMLKAEVAEKMQAVIPASKQNLEALNQKANQLNDSVALLQKKCSHLSSLLVDVAVIGTLGQLQMTIQKQEIEIVNLAKIMMNVETSSEQLETKQQQMKMLTEETGLVQASIQQKNEEIKQVNIEGLTQEKELKALAEILEQKPEEALAKAQCEMDELTQKIPKLIDEITQLPVMQALQIQWCEMLEGASEHDLDEIRKLYVRHANVIGTTCVASARKEFMDNYPIFDVVIIDEVSKATPPELLLPMLKGKKIILVGDHHQLPPLVGDDSLEETLKAILEENENLEGSEELKNLLKESLFERLFKNLPRSNKQMLAIQYRMHEKIMETISPFYENEDDRLQCGLVDSDQLRDHLLESHYVKRNDHLIWLDMPNEKRYFEEQMKDGKSRFNQAELDVIRDVLIDLDHATEMAKNSGLMAEDTKKSVGVISFYGEQVKKINRLLQQELHLKHLHIRTGTVDKFQGMEMDVILVSMVRNTQHKNADIGFANDYRRLNVALSRARELLMLIGSTEMFTERARQKEAREMYSRLLQTVKKQHGLRDPNGHVKK